MNTESNPRNADRKRLYKLLVRISVYYLVMGAVLFVLAALVPNALELAPVGGVGTLSGSADAATAELEELLLNDYLDDLGNTATAQAAEKSVFLFEDARALLFAMTGTLIMMLPVSWLYKEIHHDGEHDQSLDETTLVLPAVVAGIVLIVQHSLALAFSLAGIVAGVQFRRALSDTFDTLFIFVAIAVGIAGGIKALDIAFVLTVFFNYATLFICIFGDGLDSYHRAEKKRQRKLRKEQESAEAAGAGDDQP
ncbi:MAG: DUF4956 domain-containing protein [Halioglobus sp.]|nr:DUF4956 domain-containing protein [Halioglobus sp.]